MRLLDSNIIIYAATPQFAFLRALVKEPDIAVSAVSYVEVLGYHLLTLQDRFDFEEIFANVFMLPVSPAVLDQAVKLRQGRRMKLGDALIAATASVFNCTLVTRNTSDFHGLPGLRVSDPLSAAS